MRQRLAKRHTWLLALLATGMFGFAFALVPLYAIFCEITGLNGKTADQAALAEEIADARVDAERAVTLEFLAHVARGLAWEFRPTEAELIVRPGELNVTTYYARNSTGRTLIAHAVPSVSPGRAAQYLKKIECFCFAPQELAPGAELEMPVRFLIDGELPPEISQLTLSYTMYPVAGTEYEGLVSTKN